MKSGPFQGVRAHVIRAGRCRLRLQVTPRAYGQRGAPKEAVLAINALGLMLLDYLQFEDLVLVRGEARRWSFLCVIAPLRVPTATGSPINPIAVL